MTIKPHEDTCACVNCLIIRCHVVFQDEEEVPPEAGKEQEEATEKTEAHQEQSDTEEKSKEEPPTEEKKSNEGSEKDEPQVRQLD